MKDGLEEFLSMPRGKRGKDVPYYEFDVTRTEKPLKRKDIEREVENFVDQNNVINSLFLLKNILMSGAVRQDLTRVNIFAKLFSQLIEISVIFVFAKKQEKVMGSFPDLGMFDESLLVFCLCLIIACFFI